MSVDITIQETVNEVDITVVQNVITVNVTRTTGSGGVESVTGTLVDNTDPLNPVINVPTMAQVLTVGDKEFQQIEVDRDFELADRLKYSVIAGGMTMTLDDDLDLFPVNSLIQFVVEDNSDINATATLNFGAATNCYYLIQNITTLTLNVGDFCELKKAGAGAWILNVWNKGSGGGAVDSVNGQTGVVVLDATDVGAEPTKGSDDNYVTDAQLVIIGNTSGTNSGDNATNTTSNAYADAKVANDLTASTTVAPSKTAVNTALALKQDKGNYQKLVAVDAGNTTHTGTLTETIVSSILIPANSLDALCDLFFSYDYGKGANFTTIKVYLNTSNTLTGATLFASFNAGSNRNGGFFRKMMLRGTSLDTQASTATLLTNWPGDLLFAATNVITLNPAVNNYILVTITLSNTGDVFTTKRTVLEKLNLVP